MNEWHWIIIGVSALIMLRLFQWFFTRPTKPEPLVMPTTSAMESLMRGQSYSSEFTRAADDLQTEPSELGATGIVPGGVSWTEPERRRAASELGNKRFKRGRNLK